MNTTATYTVSYHPARSRHVQPGCAAAAPRTIEVEASSADAARRIGQMIATTREGVRCAVVDCARLTPAPASPAPAACNDGQYRTHHSTRGEAAVAVALAIAIAALLAIVMPTLDHHDELADTARAVARLGAAHPETLMEQESAR